VLTSSAVKAYPGPGSLVALATLLLSARGTGAGDIELAPFAGVQYGGSFYSTYYGRSFSPATSPHFGATMDIEVAPSWRVELFYSRQTTELASGSVPPRLDLKLERYMAGIEQEKAVERARIFGVFLLGVTRFAPGFGGYNSDERFTLGLSLGVKSDLSGRIGLRAEARGFFVIVESGGGTVCVNGSCLFRFQASGLWQGDVSAAVFVRF
jgi:Outer membrane protein beta-barrel domain